MAQSPRPAPTPLKIDHAQFWAFMFSGIRNIAAVIIALGVIIVTGWRFVQPAVDDYLTEKFQAQAETLVQSEAVLKQELATLQSDMARVLQTVDDIVQRLPETRPFVEVKGAGQLMFPARSYTPGEDVPLLYFLRLNADCPSTVRVQFYSARLASILSRYSYDIPSVQGSPSFGFQPFNVRVQLPEDMPSGSFSYSPRIIPDRTVCPGQRDVVLPPSPFFEVVRTQ